MIVKIKVYDGVKYDTTSEKVNEVIYDNVKNLSVKQMTDEEIYNLGFDTVDEYQEYAFIEFENGESATFRNSHIDIFKQ